MNILLGVKTTRRIRLKAIVFVVMAMIFFLLAYKIYFKIKRKLRAMNIDGKKLDIIQIINECIVTRIPGSRTIDSKITSPSSK